MQKDKVKTPPVPLDTGRGGVNWGFSTNKTAQPVFSFANCACVRKTIRRQSSGFNKSFTNLSAVTQ